MHTRPRLLPTALLVIVLMASACAPRTSAGTRDRPVPADARSLPRGGALDPVAAYANAGFIAEAEPVQFVGNVQYFAGATPDSTLLLLTLSMPNRDFTFASDGQGYRARYQVSLQLKRGADIAQQVDARETVRVATYRESTRDDESIVFQQYLPVPPGQYVLNLSVRDEGSARNGRHEVLISVPRITPIGLSSPVAVYRATPRASSDSLPVLVANPRATAIFGRDSTMEVYLEGYGLPAETPVSLAAISDKSAVVWRDTVHLPAHDGGVHAGVVILPVAELGVGRLTLAATPLNAADTVRMPIFISFGEEWAINSFDEMLNLLRFYATDARLLRLRESSGAERAAAWAAFYKETDPDQRTPEHEGLRTYFTRLRIANERFADEGASGWQSDRGEVYVTLGEPDQVLEQGDNTFNQRGRAQLWTYHQHRLQLVFIDQSGFGRWRLTSSSETDFESVAQRVRK
ncbi:MAG TPA: GWxTD domain-containing protein [Gemmatimonadaceae bacterium]|nr:GWxTD domain-containing protein [Gemmatimonadaceae bacterium]